VAAAGAALGVVTVTNGYSPVPFADFWGQFPFLERALGGDLRLGDLWAQANEHRIFVGRLEFLLDYRFFHGTNVFLFTVIVLSSLALAAVAAVPVWSETRSRLLAWCVFCAGAAALMSPVAAENLTWAYQVQFVQVFLFAAAAIVAVTARRPILAAVCALAASYSMANGLLVWPVVLLVAWRLRLGRRTLLGLAVAGTATFASYLWHFHFETHGNVAHPLGLLRYVVTYLGGCVRGGGTTLAALVGVAGLIALVALLRRVEVSPCAWAGAGLALFIVLSAVQTAGGRLQFGISQALSSRYAVASFTFWLALLVGFMPRLLTRLGRLGTAWCCVAAGAAALVAGIVQLPAMNELHATVYGKKLAVVAYESGVDDSTGTTTGGAPPKLVKDVFGWMQRRRLGPWAPDGLVEGMEVALPHGGLPRCRGAVESVEPVTGGRRLRGHLSGPPNSGTALVVVRGAAASGLGLVRKSEFTAYDTGHTGVPRIVLGGLCELQAPSGT
jgi:hypothetical protein